MASWKAFVNALKWAWNSSWNEGNNGVANAIEGTINKYTGAGLTPAEVEANKFSAEQAQINRDWQTQMANTTYQRTVADLKAAGLNPALAYRNSVLPTPSGSSPSSTGVGSSVGLLDLILQMRNLSNQDKQLKIQDKLADAEIKERSASTIVKENEAEQIGLETSWIDRLNQLKLDSQGIVNNLNNEQITNVVQQRDLVVKQIEKMISEIHEIDARKMLNEANASLARASASEIVTMLPYNIALTDARTKAEEASAFLDWMYFNREKQLISDGYYSSMIREAFNTASVSEYNAKTSAYDFVLHSASHLSGFGEKLFHGLQTFGEATKGLGAIFGLATGLGVAKINSSRKTGNVKKYYDSSTGSVGYRIQ